MPTTERKLEMTEFILRTDHLLAASLCTENDNVGRPHLKGVHVEPHPSGKGVLMVATDGHILVVLHDKNGHAARPAILTMNWRASELKAKRSEGYKTLHIQSLVEKSGAIASGIIKIRDTHLEVDTIGVNEMNYTFPNWRRVIPSDNSKEYPCGNGYAMDLLITIHKAIKLIDNNKTKAVLDILPERNGGPSIVHYRGNMDALFVIMPCNSTISGAYSTPEWLT